MNFLAALQQKLAPEQSLKYRLHRHLSRMAPGRSLATLHASEVTQPDFCPRRMAIMNAAGLKPPGEFLTASMEITFAQGRWLQDQVVNWFADMGVAIGDWKCSHCGRAYRVQKRPSVCNTAYPTDGVTTFCHDKRFDPIEVRFTSPVSGASGGFDMIVNLGLPKLRLVEIKTMAPDQFKTLAAPLAEHTIRTKLYLQIAEQADHPLADHVDHQTATILYVSKGYGAADPGLAGMGIKDKFSPFKEFTVERDDAQIAPLVEAAVSYTAWRTGKGGMPARICGTETDKRAQFCPARQYCFGKLFPIGAPNENPVGVA